MFTEDPLADDADLNLDDLSTDEPATDGAASTDDSATSDDATPATDSPAAPMGNTDDASDAAFVEFVVKQIVQNPDAVKITRTVDEMGVLITLEVDKDDMGKIIGKSGQTAKALRILLRIIGSKHNARVNLKIVEPEGL